MWAGHRPHRGQRWASSDLSPDPWSWWGRQHWVPCTSGPNYPFPDAALSVHPRVRTRDARWLVPLSTLYSVQHTAHLINYRDTHQQQYEGHPMASNLLLQLLLCYTGVGKCSSYLSGDCAPPVLRTLAPPEWTSHAERSSGVSASHREMAGGKVEIKSTKQLRKHECGPQRPASRSLGSEMAAQ